LGPDADDGDPNVHTTAQAVAKWGSVQAFLSHLGYSTVVGATRYWVISTTGNDGTCASHTFTATPDPTSITACTTWGHVAPLVLAGDVIFWRGGTYTEEITGFNAVGGSSGSPILYMSYPGELATINNATGMDVCAAGFTPQNRDYLTIDGFKFVYLTDNINGDRGINFCFNSFLAVRHVEVGQGLGRGFYGGAGGSNWLVEYNVTHDQELYGTHSHGIYMVNRSDSPDNQNSVFRNNLGWNPGRTCIQNTGPFNNLVLDGNVCYNVPSDSAAAFSWEQKVHNSFVRNNLCFNTDVKCFVMAVYESTITTNLPGNMTNNVVENNTFVIPALNWQTGTALSQTPNINVATASPGIACGDSFDLGHNTYRNNLLINYSGGPAIYFLTYSGPADGSYQVNGQIDPRSWSSTTTWINNDFYKLGTNGELYYSNQAGTIGTPPCTPSLIQGYQDYATFLASAGAGTTGNISSDPQFAAYQDSFYNTPSSFNFQLQPTSPAVNAGVYSVTEPMFDLLGLGRTVTPSMGALQYPTGGTNLPLNTWVMVPTHGIPAGAVGWEKLAYARNAKKHLFFGTYHEPSSEPNQGLLSYDFETNRWDLLDMVGLFHEENLPDAGHPDGSFVYDAQQGVITWLCCASGSNQYENMWHTWWYDVVGQVGRDKHTSPKPNTVFDHQQTGSFYDIATGKFIMFNAGATYSYDDTTNSWTSLSPSGTTPTAGIAVISMTYDTANGKMYAFGGQTGYTSYSNDVYEYDSSGDSWTKLAPSGTPPSPRMKAGWAYDSRNNIFLMFGGENSTVLNDTWVFDPSASGGQGSWTQLTPAANPPVASAAPFERMIYDPDHNAFILVIPGTGGYADGTYNNYPVQTWFFRYGGPGPSVGALTSNYASTSGSINRNRSGWGRAPALTASGSTLYAAWTETGLPFDNTSSQWAHIYVDSLSGITWQQLGTTSSSINSENSGDVEAHAPSIAVVNGTPWVSYYAGKPPSISPRIYAKSWTGSAWTGGAVGFVNNVPGVYQSRSSIVGVATTPYLAFIEVDKSQSSLAQQHYVYVKHFNGSAWVQDGTFLNRDSGRNSATLYSIASSIDMATDGSAPWVAWTEYTTANSILDTVPQVYVSKWNGTSWNAVGGSLNTDTSHWASDVSITNVSGQFYVAWTERTQSGNNQLFVKTFNGTDWMLVGSGPMNANTTTGWALRPSLTGDSNGNVYVGWVEQGDMGQRAQVYVSKYNGVSWSALGGSLNANSTMGSSLGVSLTVMGGQPVAAWGEVNYGTERQVFVKQWNGSQWTSLTGGSQGP
jgi:hypothetical protein